MSMDGDMIKIYGYSSDDFDFDDPIYSRRKVSKTTRDKVFDRDLKCLKCGSKSNLTIDHVKPLSMGGSNHIKNLQTLCKNCNELKADKEIDYRRSEDNV